MAAEAIPLSQPERRGGAGTFARARTAAWSHEWLLLAGIAVIGLGVWLGIPLLRGPESATDRATRVTLVETVVATGGVQVDEGQRVIKGQPLISLENTVEQAYERKFHSYYNDILAAGQF